MELSSARGTYVLVHGQHSSPRSWNLVMKREIGLKRLAAQEVGKQHEAYWYFIWRVGN